MSTKSSPHLLTFTPHHQASSIEPKARDDAASASFRSDALVASPVISTALNGGFEESTSKIITVNEFDVRTVQYMVGFLYSADYRLAPEPARNPAQQDQGEKEEEGEIVSD
ncbi:speckle-type POZ, partial [Fusarium circinatum]